jgi:hypothetical protein
MRSFESVGDFFKDCFDLCPVQFIRHVQLVRLFTSEMRNSGCDMFVPVQMVSRCFDRIFVCAIFGNMRAISGTGTSACAA